MSLPSDLVFRKTDKGVLELRHRSAGLNARVRQVLILLDGHRRVLDLCRMLPVDELNQHLVHLESGGFIARDPTRSGPDNATPAQPGSVAPTPLDRQVPPGVQEPLPLLRARLVRALLDATGPSGDDLATRIERCITLDELRSLVTPAAAVVEAVAGRHASTRFLERIGRI